MSAAALPHYDVAIVGAGPVGSLCALAHARKGARVALFEASPNSTRRMAGEWLHPPAVRILQDMGIALDTQPHSAAGRGFVVLPEDNSAPIVLPYPNGSHGLACEHTAIISALRDAVRNESDIDFIPYARVRAVTEKRVDFAHKGAMKSVTADRIVGADGRASIVRRSLGLSINPKEMTCSRMVGVTVRDATLPVEGYGHLVCGGPGPIFIYRLGPHRIRVIVDIPLEYWAPGDRVGFLSDAVGFLPETLRSAFVEALRAGEFHAAANALSPRVTYGSPERVLIGDAAGYYHPLTAVGMTLGFGDALALAENGDFRGFVSKRFQAIRTPELLAMEIYEVFADHRAETVAVRRMVYRRWRASSAFRNRTMRLLACEDTSTARLGLSGFMIVVRAVASEIPRSLNRFAWRRVRDVANALAFRVKWLLRGVRQLRKAQGAGEQKGENQGDPTPYPFARALLISLPSSFSAPPPVRPKDVASPDAAPALRSAAERLLRLQSEEGAWEGEMTWCSMLTAQYALLHYIMARPIAPERRRLLLHSFEQTRLEGGLWGLHEQARPNLFVTTLAYVAARTLGVERGDPLIEPARRFLRAEQVLNIPSWGKFWLALLNLYDWRGVRVILPELWRLPRWIPLHPSNWYCHTRLIYMAMAAIYPHRFQAPRTPLIASLREELYPEGFARVDFAAGRNRLRDADLYARPSAWLRAGYGFARLFERFHGKRLRARCTEALVRRVKWELRTTSHASISPVSGFLNILALWLRDPDDADCRKAFDKLDDWIWEDEALGARVTGARSSSWDTGFSLQALALAPTSDGVRNALQRGAAFLRRQQIDARFEGFREAYRTDPKGGWCFPGKWHGWPVTDCTAEALLGILAANPKAISAEAVGDAVRFMLRGQNRDGGFGSYEARRAAFGLEWLNPAEMFGESMTEHSWVECTASCLAALAACKKHFPQGADPAAANAMARGEAWLRRAQASDGSWRGVWGVQFIYGALFGIRGLLAAGARPGDPGIRLACRWLLDRQLADGGWGERHTGCLIGQYVPHEESQVIQTAWALIALLEADDPNWTAISRGVRFLIDAQQADGTWPRQDMAGVFFRTAMLDYALYRQYFPLYALGVYERRRQARLNPETSPFLACAATDAETGVASSVSLTPPARRAASSSGTQRLLAVDAKRAKQGRYVEGAE